MRFIFVMRIQAKLAAVQRVLFAGEILAGKAAPILQGFSTPAAHAAGRYEYRRGATAAPPGARFSSSRFS